MDIKRQGKGRKLGIWVFPEYAGCVEQVQQISSAIDHPIAREIHYDASNERVGGLYQISIILGSVRKGIDLGQVALIRRRSHYVVTVGAFYEAIGQEYFDGQTALKFSPSVVSDDRQKDLELKAPASEYIDTDYECSGYAIKSAAFRQKILEFLGQETEFEKARWAMRYSALDKRVERLVSVPGGAEGAPAYAQQRRIASRGSLSVARDRRSSIVKLELEASYGKVGNSEANRFFKEFISRA